MLIGDGEGEIAWWMHAKLQSAVGEMTGLFVNDERARTASMNEHRVLVPAAHDLPRARLAKAFALTEKRGIPWCGGPILQRCPDRARFPGPRVPRLFPPAGTGAPATRASPPVQPERQDVTGPRC